eukprot:gene14762-20813_t
MSCNLQVLATHREGGKGTKVEATKRSPPEADTLLDPCTPAATEEPMVASTPDDPNISPGGATGVRASDPIITRLLTAVDKSASWLERLPAYGILALSKLLQSLASDKQSRQLLPAAAKPLTTIIKVYTSIRHLEAPSSDNDSDSDSGEQVSKKKSRHRYPCCAASHSLLTTLLVLCSLDAHLLAIEGFAEKVVPVLKVAASVPKRVAAPAAPPKLVPTPLIGNMVKELKKLINSSPLASIPDLDWDGESSTKLQGRVPADPCCPCRSLSPNGEEMQNAAIQHGPISLVELWMHVLASAACCGGPPIAKELYRVDATILSKEAYNSFRSSIGVLAAAERLNCAVANLCPNAAQEICKSGNVPGLLGIVLGGGNGYPPALPSEAPKDSAVSSALAALTAIGKAGGPVEEKQANSLEKSSDEGSSVASSHSRREWVPGTPRGMGPLCAAPAGPPASLKAVTGSVGIDPELALKALDRLATVLEACKGFDFMRIVRVGGPLAVSCELLTQSSRPTAPMLPASGPAGAAPPLGYWEAAVYAAGPEASKKSRVQSSRLMSAAPGMRRNQAASAQNMAVMLKEQQAFWDAARVLFIGSLERSQRMQKLNREQAPRFGFWGAVPAPKLLSLEQRLRQQWCDMMLPMPSLAAREASSRAAAGASRAIATVDSASSGGGASRLRQAAGPIPELEPGASSVPDPEPEASTLPETKAEKNSFPIEEPLVELPPSLMPPPKPATKKVVEKAAKKGSSKVASKASTSEKGPSSDELKKDAVASPSAADASAAAMDKGPKDTQTSSPKCEQIENPSLSPEAAVSMTLSVESKSNDDDVISASKLEDSHVEEGREEGLHVLPASSVVKDTEVESRMEADQKVEPGEQVVVTDVVKPSHSPQSPQLQVGSSQSLDDIKDDVPSPAPESPAHPSPKTRPSSASPKVPRPPKPVEPPPSDDSIHSSVAVEKGVLNADLHQSLRRPPSKRHSQSSTMLSTQLPSTRPLSASRVMYTPKPSSPDMDLGSPTLRSRPSSAMHLSSTSNRPGSPHQGSVFGLNRSMQRSDRSFSNGSLSDLNQGSELKSTLGRGGPSMPQISDSGLSSFDSGDRTARVSSGRQVHQNESENASSSNSPGPSMQYHTKSRVSHSPAGEDTKTEKRAAESEESKMQATPSGGVNKADGPGGQEQICASGSVAVDENSEVGQARAAWKTMPLSKQIKWSQTSSDVMVEVMVPKGTSKREIKVDTKSKYLSVNLKWYGSIVDGPMPHKVKAAEVMWTPKNKELPWHALFIKDVEKIKRKAEAS